MSAFYGVRLNFKGVKETLRAPGVRAELLQRMQRVADRANATGGNVTHSAYSDDRPDAQLPVARVGADSYEALKRESETGYLSSSLDAAGGRNF